MKKYRIIIFITGIIMMILNFIAAIILMIQNNLLSIIFVIATIFFIYYVNHMIEWIRWNRGFDDE